MDRQRDAADNTHIVSKAKELKSSRWVTRAKMFNLVKNMSDPTPGFIQQWHQQQQIRVVICLFLHEYCQPSEKGFADYSSQCHHNLGCTYVGDVCPKDKTLEAAHAPLQNLHPSLSTIGFPTYLQRHESCSL